MARRFGATWWGKAWIEALEHKAGLDPNRLPRGRTYARQDRVARLEVESGRITALVRGSRVLPYKVVVQVPIYDDAQWAAVTGAIAAKARHAAALLDGELEPGVLSDARDAGVDLLPGPGDLFPRCSCPDWADPCKHAAAVCYLVADVLDDDAFVLFALRGRSREALLNQVRQQRQLDAAGSSSAADDGGDGLGSDVDLPTSAIDPGVLAREAWAQDHLPSPSRRDLPSEPGMPAEWPSDPPAGAPFTAAGLSSVAIDAARRAWHQLAEGAPSHLDLDGRADLARRAADRLDDSDHVADLARTAGLGGVQLQHQAAAWRYGGADGVAMLDEVLWRPNDERVAEGLRAFAEAGFDAADVQVRSNRFTAGEVQLRVTADDRWWRFERRGRGWELVEPPADSAAELISG